MLGMRNLWSRSMAIDDRCGRIEDVSDPLADLARLSGVPAAVVAAQDAADAVLRDRGRREIPASVSASALLAGAKASAELEGPEWLPGAVRLSTVLLELAPLVRRSPGQFLAQAHLVLARDLLPPDELGAIVVEAERVQGVCALLTGKTKAPALVLAAVAHAELALAAPFARVGAHETTQGLERASGSGIVARAVEHAVLINSGLDARAALVVEAGHLPSAPYRKRLNDYSQGSITGVRDWLLHCCDAVVIGADKSLLEPTKRPGSSGGKGL